MSEKYTTVNVIPCSSKGTHRDSDRVSIYYAGSYMAGGSDNSVNDLHRLYRVLHARGL